MSISEKIGQLHSLAFLSPSSSRDTESMSGNNKNTMSEIEKI